MPIGIVTNLTNGSGTIEMLPGEFRVPFFTKDCRETVAVGDVVQCEYGFGNGGELAGKVIATNIHKSKGN